MSRKPNFFKVGIFVIIGLVILVIGIIVFGGSEYFRKKIDFETYFDQSIEGLSVGAPVKVLGVEVGSVSEISFARTVYDSNLPYIIVRGFYYPESMGRHIDTYREFEERAGKAVEKGFRLQLASQGITGVAFLNGEFFEPGQYPPYKIDWKPEYLYIPSAPSTLTTITNSITELTRSVNQINFKQIADDIQSLLEVATKTVEEAEVAKVTQDLQSTILEFKKVGSNFDSLLGSEETKQSVKDLAVALENVKTASEGLPETIEELNDTLNRLDNIVSTHEQEVGLITENLSIFSEDLRQFLNTARKYPSWVLFGNQPPPINLDEEK